MLCDYIRMTSLTLLYLDYIQMTVFVEEFGNLVPFVSIVSGSASYELICYSCHDCNVC